MYLKQKGETLDRAYLAGELEKLGLAEFEERNRSLALHLFGGGTLTAQDEEMFDYILSSGTYGTVQNRVRNRVRQLGAFGRLRYMMNRLFLPIDKVKEYYPVFWKVPVLLPFLPLYRLAKVLPVKGDHLRAELQALTDGKTKKK